MTTLHLSPFSSLAVAPEMAHRFFAPISRGCHGGELVLAIGPFRDWLTEHMLAHDLTALHVAQQIKRDEAIVRGWFGVRSRDWRSKSSQRRRHRLRAPRPRPPTRRIAVGGQLCLGLA
jgi:hypothetical protein